MNNRNCYTYKFAKLLISQFRSLKSKFWMFHIRRYLKTQREQMKISKLSNPDLAKIFHKNHLKWPVISVVRSESSDGLRSGMAPATECRPVDVNDRLSRCWSTERSNRRSAIDVSKAALKEAKEREIRE